MTDDSDRVALRRAVLTAPLWMPTSSWSSRSIADAVGVSQSFVARLWREPTEATDAGRRVSRALAEQRMSPVGMLVTSTASILVLQVDATVSSRPDAPLPPRAARRLRAVLAADLARPHGDDPAAVARFWDDVDGPGVPASALLVLTSGDADVPVRLSGRDVPTGADGWQGLLHPLTRSSADATGERLMDLESRLRRWHADRRGPFVWLAREGAPAPVAVTQRPGAPERALGDEILAAVREGLADGTFGGDEISERALASKLHVGRARVRQALLSLADEGLVTATPHGAMAVRLPAVADIVELYVARRALGAIALRAAGRWTAEGRGAVAEILAELGRAADRDEVDRAQELDIAFQIAIAKASGLTRIPGMLESLCQQLLMYISVLGVRYSFPPAMIVAQDTAIFRAVDARDPDQAIRIWHEKMDVGGQYMLEQTDALFGRRPASRFGP